MAGEGAGSGRPARSRRLEGPFVALLALALLLPGISAPLWNRDEAEYAAVARTMARGGSWAAPRLFGTAFAEKPPLAFWLTAASFRLFGESEAAARLPHVLLAVLAVLLLRRLADRLSPGTGPAAALILASSLLWIVYARLLLTDSALVAFDLAAILALEAAESRRSAAPVAAAGAALGAALLAKGPIALAAPALFAAGSVSPAFPLRRAVLRFGAAASIGTALSLPWWLSPRGAAASAAFFGRENLDRFLAPMQRHGGPIVYYFGVLAVGLFPWTAYLLLRPARRLDGAGRRAAVWAGGLFAFFSLSATKLPHYLLPALPALAFLAARGFRESSYAARRGAARTAAATAALLAVGGAFAVSRSSAPDRLLPAAAVLAALAVLAAALAAAAAGHRPGAAGSVLFAAGLGFALPPALERGRTLAFLGRSAAAARRPGEPAGGWRFVEPALGYYAGSAVLPKWKEPADLAAAVSASPARSALLWIEAREAPALARAGWPLGILARGENAVETGPLGTLLLCRARPPTRADRADAHGRNLRARSDLRSDRSW